MVQVGLRSVDSARCVILGKVLTIHLTWVALHTAVLAGVLTFQHAS